MKAISLFLLTMGILIPALLVPARANAAMDWYVCSVEQAGPAGTGDAVHIMLSDTADPPAFSDLWFQAPDGRQKEHLAVALTAMSLDMKVNVRVDPDEPELSERIIKRIFLLKE